MEKIIRLLFLIIAELSVLSCSSQTENFTALKYYPERIKVGEREGPLHLRLNKEYGLGRIEASSGDWDRHYFILDSRALLREYRLDSISYDKSYCYFSSKSKFSKCLKVIAPEETDYTIVDEDVTYGFYNYSNYNDVRWLPVTSIWQRLRYSFFPISRKWKEYWEINDEVLSFWDEVKMAVDYIFDEFPFESGKRLNNPYLYQPSDKYGGLYIMPGKSRWALETANSPKMDAVPDTLNYFQAFYLIDSVDTSMLKVLAEDKKGILYDLGEEEILCNMFVKANKLFLSRKQDLGIERVALCNPYNSQVIANLRHLLDDNGLNGYDQYDVQRLAREHETYSSMNSIIKYYSCCYYSLPDTKSDIIEFLKLWKEQSPDTFPYDGNYGMDAIRVLSDRRTMFESCKDSVFLFSSSTKDGSRVIGDPFYWAVNYSSFPKERFDYLGFFSPSAYSVSGDYLFSPAYDKLEDILMNWNGEYMDGRIIVRIQDGVQCFPDSAKVKSSALLSDVDSWMRENQGVHGVVFSLPLNRLTKEEIPFLSPTLRKYP